MENNYWNATKQVHVSLQQHAYPSRELEKFRHTHFGDKEREKNILPIDAQVNTGESKIHSKEKRTPSFFGHHSETVPDPKSNSTD
jgi:hypothetical protein